MKHKNYIIGEERTCRQDALYHCLVELGLFHDDLYDKIKEKTLPGGKGENTKMSVIIDFVCTLGLQCISLKSVYRHQLSLWQLPGGPILNVLRFTEGIYILNIRIEVMSRFDNHSVSFNAFKRKIIDNDSSNIITIEPVDLESPSNAYQVLKYLFPSSTHMLLKDVYEIRSHV